MFIVKKFAPKFKFCKPTLEWAIIPDNTINDLWKEVVSVYDSYFKDHAKDNYESLISNPVVILENPNDLRGITYDGTNVYVTNITPKNFRVLTEEEFEKLTEQLSRLFSRILSARIEELFFDRHGRFSKFNKVAKIPMDETQAKKMLELHIPDENIMVFTFHRDCEKVTHEILKEVKSTCHSIGRVLSKAIINKNLRSYENVVSVMRKVNTLNNMRVDKWMYPPTIHLAEKYHNNRLNKFRICVYLDGKLMFEKRGNIISYAWIDMINKLINQIKLHGIGPWVITIGIVDIVEPSE